VTSPISGAEFSAADAGGEPGGFSASPYAELGEDAGHVMLGCLPGDEQPLDDLGVRQALADKPQHLLLALDKPADVLRAPPRHPRPEFPQQCSRRIGVAARASKAVSAVRASAAATAGSDQRTIPASGSRVCAAR
jgi:hypothetical protein